MTLELSQVVTLVSVIFGVIGITLNLKRNSNSDVRSEATQLTTVIVKLENIGIGVAEIKSEMNNIKNDIKEVRERVAKVEESANSAHKRLDGFSNRYGGE